MRILFSLIFLLLFFSLGLKLGLAQEPSKNAVSVPSTADATPPATLPATSLTPPSPATPLIHGAKVFGVHPGHPFLFTIAATGDRPMTFAADGLPAGLAIDASSGQISGTAPGAGDYRITLHAKNALGETQRPLLVKVGDTRFLPSRLTIIFLLPGRRRRINPR